MDLFKVSHGYAHYGFLTKEEAFSFVEGKGDWAIIHYVLKEPSPQMILWAFNTLLDSIGQMPEDYEFIVAQCYLADSDGYRYKAED